MTGETLAAAASQASHVPLIRPNATREGIRLARRLFALVAFAATSWHVPLEAQTLLVFDDKSAFLAATGAASATGPLPDIGVVADSGNPGGTAHVGSLTFSLAPGGNNLYIGAAGTGAAPDWYPETPGNDIAMGFENLAVRMPSPVFSLGFEIVEPDATLPAFGGTPVESTYKVTLFNGVTVVGEFVFNSVPNDVVAFIGVWSDTLFDRAEIVDVTESPFVDDDEYFGEFYTGARPAPPTATSPIIATGAPVPGSSGTFTTFPQSPAVGSTIAAFLGLGSGGQAGVYRCGAAMPVDPCLEIASLSTAIPGKTGTFTGFTDLAAAGASIAFIATGSGQVGVYDCETNSPVDPCHPVADLTTAIPGGIGTFTAFTELATAGSSIAFIGTGSGQVGVYGCETSSPTHPCHPIADLTTAIPGGTGAFSGFTQVATAGPSTSFIGTGAGQQGIYHCESAIPTDPCQPIADLTAAIPGGTGTFTSFTDLAARGTITSFVGTGTGQQGVYRCDSAQPVEPCQPIADLTTAIPGGTGTFTGFTSVSASLEHTAFLGLGDGGQAGIYLASALTKIVAVGDTLEGKVVSDLRFGRSGLDGSTVVFTASFTDGSEGVFVVGVGRYSFEGFLAPVDNPPVLNQVQAGKAIPVRFSLGDDRGLAIFADGYPQSAPMTCDSTAVVDGIEQTVTAGASGLSYDAASDTYTYVWKTNKAWAKTCRQLILKLKDGTVHHANFTFR